ncbi:hypothetical protein FS837_003615 [Tulasnella sp. UAMH 9824]|nr:hypothetical protein FS837_003615 [Tulasnella sp. UAMH 9824]
MASLSSKEFPPKTNAPRPPLPIADYNIKLQEEVTHQPVKFQIIVRDGHEIIVGRVKVPTPSNHAFILRRFDTGAVSLSTMFRAAYPGASEEAEKAELAWVKTNYDIAGQNGGGKLRLAGIWVPPGLALHFAEHYGLGHILPSLAHAVPEEKSAYRKNARTTGSSTVVAAVPAVGTNSSSQPESTSGLGIPTSLPPTSPKSPKTTPSKPAKASSPVRQPPPKRSRKSASPAPSLLAKPTPTKALRSSPRRPPKVQEEEDEPEVPGPNPDQDIREAQEEAAQIMAKGRAAQQLDPVTPAGKKKRNIEATETPPIQFDMEKIEQSAMEVAPVRPVVNPRRLANLQPTQKAAAWGGLLMAVGWGAATYLPQYLPNAFGLW